VAAVSLLGSILTLRTLSALAGLDPSILEPPEEIVIEPSEVRYVEAKGAETVVRGRPWIPFRRMATIARGTRLAVRGEVQSRDAKGCSGKPWYAVWPFGYVCSEHVRATDEAPLEGETLGLEEGQRVPHSYAVVRDEGVPSYANVEMARQGISERALAKRMVLVVTRSLEVDGVVYVQSQDGTLVPKQSVGWMGQGSEFQGVLLETDEVGPFFGWARVANAKVRAQPNKDADVVGRLELRRRVPLLEQAGEGRSTWWRIGDGAWVEAEDLNEVHVIDPPQGVLTEVRTSSTGNDQWIDVDVGEQVVVAYRGATPVFATLVSSGLGSPTPLGNYPVWAKVASMDMGNQDYEDRPYLLQGVPWVLLFQGHNALHGAYWHNRFGNRKSHGCVNLAPLDARWLFEWAGPSMPPGWTGFLPNDLHRSIVVHVRDSSRDPGAQFTQQRAWGPPDREEEQRRLEAAQERRAALAEAEAEVNDAHLPQLGEPRRLDPDDARIPQLRGPPRLEAPATPLVD
jgi:hypothetical protein